MSRLSRVLGASLLLATVLATPSAAAQPTMEFIPINEIGVLDEFLTEECGFDIFLDVTGHVIFRDFVDSEGNVVRQVHNFAVSTTFYSEFGELTLQDVGPDRVWVNDDGSVTVFITGNLQSIQLPGEGRVYSNVGFIEILITQDAEGNEVIEVVSVVGQHSDADQIAIICEAIGPN